MAAPAVTVNKKLGSRTRTITVTQSGINNGAVMFEVPEPLHSLSVQLTGTQGGATVKIRGGDDGTIGNIKDLPTALNMVAPGTKSVAPADLGFRYYGVDVSGSGSSSNLVITLIAKLAY